MKDNFDLDQLLSTNLSNIAVIRSVHSDLLQRQRLLNEEVLEQFLLNEQHFLSVIKESKNLQKIKKNINHNLLACKKLLSTRYTHSDPELIDQHKVDQLHEKLSTIKDEVVFFLTPARYFLDEFCAETVKNPIRLVFSNDLLFIINENSQKLQHVLAYEGMTTHRQNETSNTVEQARTSTNNQDGYSSQHGFRANKNGSGSCSNDEHASNFQNSLNKSRNSSKQHSNTRRSFTSQNRFLPPQDEPNEDQKSAYNLNSHISSKFTNKNINNASNRWRNNKNRADVQTLVLKTSSVQQIIIASASVIESIESYFSVEQNPTSSLSPQRLLFNIRTNRPQNNPTFVIRDKKDFDEVLKLKNDEYLSYETTFNINKVYPTSQIKYLNKKKQNCTEKSINFDNDGAPENDSNEKHQTSDFDTNSSFRTLEVVSSNPQKPNESFPLVIRSQYETQMPPLTPHHLVQQFYLKRLAYHLTRLDKKSMGLSEKIQQIIVFYEQFLNEMIELLAVDSSDKNDPDNNSNNEGRRIHASHDNQSTQNITILIESHLSHILSFLSPKIFYKRHKLSDLDEYYMLLETVLRPKEYNFTYLLKRLDGEKQKFEHVRMNMAKMEILKILEEE